MYQLEKFKLENDSYQVHKENLASCRFKKAIHACICRIQLD